ncbi:MAG TPA: cytochrome c [Flavisolibacter sp.]|nr:cytochrome c [Flavisolibacter sp.]
MKKYFFVISLLLLIISFGLTAISSCAVSSKIKDKTGTQLWGENCGRCHNPPGPGEFNTSNWDIVGRHMRIRANITEDEEKKIIDYLKTTGN